MKIDSYTFGRIVIDGRTYTSDVIIFPDRVFSPWWRKEGHLLQMEDLTEVVNEKPELLIIGCGYSGVMQVPRELIQELERLGIEVVIKRTTEAVRLFNEAGRKKKIAAFHLTC